MCVQGSILLPAPCHNVTCIGVCTNSPNGLLRVLCSASLLLSGSRTQRSGGGCVGHGEYPGKESIWAGPRLLMKPRLRLRPLSPISHPRHPQSQLLSLLRDSPPSRREVVTSRVVWLQNTDRKVQSMSRIPASLAVLTRPVFPAIPTAVTYRLSQVCSVLAMLIGSWSEDSFLLGYGIACLVCTEIWALRKSIEASGK